MTHTELRLSRRVALAFALYLGLVTIWLAPPAAAQEPGAGPHAFPVERINPGLPDIGSRIVLETPQATLESFVAAADREDWATAAHALDLRHIDPAEQPGRGPMLARQLNEVMQRAVWLDWNDLPDRPDGLDAYATTKDPMAGEPRRSIRLALVELPQRPVTIRLSRLKPAEGDAVWLFSAQTVDNVPALHDAYGPTSLERSLPAFLRAPAFWTLSWWEVIALPLVLLLALAAALMTHGFVDRLLRRQFSAIAGRILDSIRMPVSLIAFAAVFAIVKAFLFTFSGPINILLNPIQTVVFVVALGLVAIHVVDAVLDRIARRHIAELSDPETAEERHLYTNISAARRLTIAFAFVLGAALVLVQVNAFETLGFSLLASAGAIGLVLAFAARSVLSNVMASLQIALSKTARIGDAVLFNGHWCYVEKINFTHLQLRSWDRRRLMVPVSEFVSSTVENWSKQDPSLIKPVELRLDHRADLERLRTAFQAFVERDEDVMGRDDCKVQVIDQDRSGILVRFYIAAADPVTAWDLHCRLREHLARTIADLEAESSPEGKAPVYLPREREVIVADGAPEPARRKSAAR